MEKIVEYLVIFQKLLQKDTQMSLFCKNGFSHYKTKNVT